MRRGFNGLSAIAKLELQGDPYIGHVFVFRANLIKLLWWSGNGMNLHAKR
jgi:transposase